jgi:hypothetical protein
VLKLLLLLVFAAAAAAQDAPTLAARTATVLQRESGGHSPTDDDINAAGSITPAPTADQVREALPNLVKLLASTDGPARTYALSLIIGLQNSADRLAADAVPAAGAAPAPAPVATGFSADISKILSPAIPQIAAHLTDEVIPNPSLAATALGGFLKDTPPAVFPPLYKYLQRDDAIAGVGLNVVQDLLGYGPLTIETAVAIGRYLRRRDQTSSSRANLVDALSSSPNQSQPLNKTLLEYLSSDDDSLRARLVLSLPQLDLAPDVFADTKAKVTGLAENRNENLQVVNAAKAVAPCWTAPKTPNCPNYTTP